MLFVGAGCLYRHLTPSQYSRTESCNKNSPFSVTPANYGRPIILRSVGQRSRYRPATRQCRLWRVTYHSREFPEFIPVNAYFHIRSTFTGLSKQQVTVLVSLLCPLIVWRAQEQRTLSSVNKPVPCHWLVLL